MSWRRIRALMLVLLGLLIAAPLSSGDKGLWLSLVATPSQVLDLPADRLPAEHSILLLDRITRIARSVAHARPDRVEVAGALGPGGTAWTLRAGEQLMVSMAVPPRSLGNLFADHAAPRAPPA
jgi:hypothetical protein